MGVDDAVKAFVVIDAEAIYIHEIFSFGNHQADMVFFGIVHLADHAGAPPVVAVKNDINGIDGGLLVGHILQLDDERARVFLRCFLGRKNAGGSCQEQEGQYLILPGQGLKGWDSHEEGLSFIKKRKKRHNI